jgi:hypothetical protein
VATLGGPTKSALSTRFVEVSKLGEGSLPRFAEQALPLRQAIICAAFPYRRQVEEFQQKLHLPSLAAVLSEASEEQDDRGLLPAFRFLGVDVQRREINREGKPINAWKTLDLTAELKPYIIANGTRFEPDPTDPPQISSLIVDGLWMPLLQQFHENQNNKYPPVEMELPNIRKTLDDLRAKPPEKIAVGVNPITSGAEKFNPFQVRQSRRVGGPTAPAGRLGSAAPVAAPTPGGGPIGGGGVIGGDGGGAFSAIRGMGRRDFSGRLAARGTPGAADPTNPAAEDIVVPEYVLVRVVDVTIEPGKIYEYRLHVRMANPNYNRKAEVLSPSYAVDKELNAEKERTDADWFVVPKKVSVPPEFRYYSIDMAEADRVLEGVPYRGIHSRDTPSRDQTVFQIHRWLEDAARPGAPPQFVGEWTVAERVIVARGEFIGRTEKVNVPLWNAPSEAFVLAAPVQQADRRQTVQPGIEVDFSLPDDDAILVDFQSGNQHFERKSRREERAEPVKVDEKTSTEVLIVSSDGHVTARDTSADAENLIRKDRLTKWRDRIRDVFTSSTPSPITGGPANPFAAPGGAGAPRGGRPGIR